LLVGFAIIILGLGMIVISVVQLLKFGRENIYAVLCIFPIGLGVGALVTAVKVLRGETPRTWLP